jgi:hypothetical protein
MFTMMTQGAADPTSILEELAQEPPFAVTSEVTIRDIA